MNVTKVIKNFILQEDIKIILHIKAMVVKLGKPV